MRTAQHRPQKSAPVLTALLADTLLIPSLTVAQSFFLADPHAPIQHPWS